MRTPYRYLILSLLGLVMLIGIVPHLTQAQIDAGACPALVQKALQEVGNNCTGIDRNSACYGFNRIDASFVEEQPEDYFSTPADRAQLLTLDTLQTAPLDSANNLWGIAVLNVQANVPQSLPGQAVVFMLLGDVQIDNAVDPANAFTPVEPVNVITTTNVNVRSGPGTIYNVVSSLPSGTVVPADGLNANGEWVRVLMDNVPMWISRDLVRAEVDGSLDTLPQITSETRTPMQAFYFRTGFTGVECTESPPSVLVIQGPENLSVNLTANGADIQIGSTVALFTNDQGEMVLIVIDGKAVVDGIEIPPGFAITIKLGEDGNVEGSWYGFRAITFEELASLLPLENIPVSLLHYPIVLPTMDQIAAFLERFATTPEPESTGEPGSGGTGMGGETVIISGGVLPTPGQYQTSGGNCSSLRGSARIGNISPDGNSFTWGVLTLTRVEADLFRSAGGIYIRIIDANTVRVGGEVAGACVMDWTRVGD